MSSNVDPKAFDTALSGLELEADRWAREMERLTRVGRARTEDYGYASAQLELARDAITPMRAYYSIKRWTRYYLVPGGKIHKSTGCQTCNHFYISTGWSQTNFIWLLQSSGETVADMITAHGTDMCSVCFPEAPLDPAYQAAVRKTAAEKDAARNAKLEARQAKLDATPKGDDGEPLKVGHYGEMPKTERGARNLLAHFLHNVHWYRLTSTNGAHPQDAEWIADAHTVARSIARFTVDESNEEEFRNAADVIFTEAWRKQDKKAAADYRKALKDPRNQY